jgi:AcrR family transcriptional regulator
MPRSLPLRTTVQNPELVRQRHKAILSASIDVIRKKGFNRTTIKDIATAANLPVGSLYQYIGKKVDILAMIAMDSTEYPRQAVERALEQEGDEPVRLVAAFRALLHSLAERRRAVKILYWDAISLSAAERRRLIQGEVELRQLLEGIIERGIKSGLFRPVDSFIVAQDIILMAHAWAIKGWAIKDRYDLESYVDAQLDILMHAIAADPADRMARDGLNSLTAGTQSSKGGQARKKRPLSM